jgi:ribosomal protein S18 acetylase RimI-like enzyme
MSLSVFSDNRKAIKFFKNNGFEIRGETRDVASGRRMLVMKKVLARYGER